MALVETSVTESKEDAALVEILGEALAEYIADAKDYVQVISETTVVMESPGNFHTFTFVDEYGVGRQ